MLLASVVIQRLRSHASGQRRIGLWLRRFVIGAKEGRLGRLAWSTPSITNPIGFPIENALAIASLINGGIAEACPDLRLAFSHGGGGFPFMLPRYSHAWDGAWNEEQPEPPPPAANSQGLARSPAEYARRFYYDTLLFDHRAIRYLIEIIGHSQLMVGSDYPYMQREEPVGRTLRSMGLSDEIVEDISSRNCLRFLGLERQ